MKHVIILDINFTMLTSLKIGIHISMKSQKNYIYMGGDLNTDFSRNTPQTWELSQFCNNECNVQLCKHNVSTVEYTYESVSNGTRFHIDHVLVTSNLE